MTRNRLLTTLALTMLLVTAGCSSIVGTNQSPNANPDANATNPNAAPQADSGPPRTVEVGASGQVETAPTRAVIRVGVTSRAESVETVRRQLAENASRMRQALQDAGVDPSQIATEDYDIRRDRHPRRERGEREQPRVRGRHAFVITLSNTSRVGQVVVTAVQNGATNVRDVRFTVDRQTRLDLRRQALANATQNARERAQVAADSAGLQLAGVHTVRTQAVDVHPIHRREAGLGAGADAGGAPTTFEGGTVTITAQVQVTYNATEA